MAKSKGTEINLYYVAGGIAILLFLFCAIFPFGFGYVLGEKNWEEPGPVCQQCCAINMKLSEITGGLVDPKCAETSEGYIPIGSVESDEHPQLPGTEGDEDIPVSVLCYDSDGGFMPDIPGYCKSNSGNYSDMCITSVRLMEQYCSDGYCISGAYDCEYWCHEPTGACHDCRWEDDPSGFGGSCQGTCPTGYKCQSIMSEICDCQII